MLLSTLQETVRDIHQILGLNILFWGVFTATSALIMRNEIQMKEVEKLAPASWIAAVFGALFLALLPPKLLLVAIIIFIVYFLLIHRGYDINIPWFTKYLDARFVGAVSGFLQGGGARGSDMRFAYLLSRGFSLAETAATSAVIVTELVFLLETPRVFNGSNKTSKL